jgi:uncharacterized protein (TIGR00297 family)
MLLQRKDTAFKPLHSLRPLSFGCAVSMLSLPCSFRDDTQHTAVLNISRILAGLILSILIGGLAYRRRSLTAGGWLGAVITGTLTFGFGGWSWGLALVTFFVTSSALSHFRRARKQRIADQKFEKGGQRDLFQALANGGAGALLALLYGLSDEPPALLALFAGIMATVTADTWATELGVLSARPPRLITTWRQVEPGTSGAITSVGLAASSAGALIIGLVLLAAEVAERGDWHPWLLLAALFGGLGGSLVDSLLGATAQAIYGSAGGETERHVALDGTPNRLLRGLRWMNNDLVNFLSSLAGGLIALGVWSLF